MKSKETSIFNIFYPEKISRNILQFEAESGQYSLNKKEGLLNEDSMAAFLSEAGNRFIFNCRLLSNKIFGEANIGFIVSSNQNLSSDAWLFLLNDDKKVEFVEIVDGEVISTEKIKVRNPEYFQITREGNELFFETATKFRPLKKSKIVTIDLPEICYLGFFVEFAQDATFSVKFDNVRFIKPAPKNFIPYTDYGKSNLEILNVETGHRKIILASDEHYEAPNWKRDNQFILNSKGLLYLYNKNLDQPQKMKTGFATSNNNDHGLSPDEKYIFLSHHVEKEPHDKSSKIFRMPIDNGEPVLITPEGPSYWHGVSPDGKEIAYTAKRRGYFNIYTKPIEGGDEFQLTMNPALDDGPEYSPDGRYIYYNSCRSGKMKIWRMKLDGSEQEQITFDEYNDWFPHFSPDGSEIIFLSYPPEVIADEHPYYQQVMLRMIDLKNKEEINVLAFLYGGQGTINVPSWSKDGTSVAFCSYSF